MGPHMRIYMQLLVDGGGREVVSGIATGKVPIFL